MKQVRGFTLAELLTALSILGVIATFTIPKVLQAQRANAWNATAKEAASIISEAYAQYRHGNAVTASTSASALTPYLNYVRLEGAGSIDHVTGDTSIACGGVSLCYRMHNGAVFRVDADNSFGGTAATNYLMFFFDPDGKDSGSTTGAGKSIVLDLYFNGRIGESSQRASGAQTFAGGGLQSWPSDPASDWFSWNN